MPSINANQIESAIREYWQLFEMKATLQQQSWYAPGCLIFTSTSKRAELSRLVAVRRQREYLHDTTKLRVAIKDLHVVTLGMTGAVAAYSLEFHAQELPNFGKLARRTEEHLTHGRVTQIFELGEDEELRIVHEHISAPCE